MSWDDTARLESALKSALDTFNWPEAEAICQGIIGRIRTEPDLIPEATAKRCLQNLRRKRRLNLMTSLADAMVQSGLRSPQVRRQYAQALIDQGSLGAGEIILQSIIQDAQGVIGEELEAHGLMGRIYKQLYINNNDPTSTRNRTNLARALNEYLHVYQLNPFEYLWHGINVVALAARAQRDMLPPAGQPDAVAMAKDILAALDERESKSITGSLSAWDLATRLEVYVALGLHEKTPQARADYFRKAEGEAFRYIASDDADAFEINSTLRQFTEVWQLDDKQPPGDHLLPILRAGHLRKLGAATEKDPKKVEEEATIVANAINDLEARFGSDGMVTLKWYKKGLDQCNAVARVERLSGRGHGTGWLVKASDFFPGKEGVLLLTNAHVVSDFPNPFTNPLAIAPSDAQVNFQAAGNGEVYRVANKVFWTSSPDELDATFLELNGKPSVAPLTLHDQKVSLPEPPPSEPDQLPRLYVIGHPSGRDLELSLQDNRLLACNDRLIHYRTPTEGGSSGSPVFEHEDWRVVALHHKGSETMRRLNGDGTYEANEGIAIHALRAVTQHSKPSQ